MEQKDSQEGSSCADDNLELYCDTTQRRRDAVNHHPGSAPSSDVGVRPPHAWEVGARSLFHDQRSKRDFEFDSATESTLGNLRPCSLALSFATATNPSDR